MKAVILVLSPKECISLLNGDLSILVRKKFPKDYVGWVHIYCTKGKKLLFDKEQNIYFVGTHNASLERHSSDTDIFMNAAYELSCDNLTGKVVARFWCDKVEEILARKNKKWYHLADTIPMCDGDIYHICQKSCLSQDELHNYLKSKRGKAIHITNLEIFDKPKEIKDFYHHFNLKRCERLFSNNNIEIDSKMGGLRQPTKFGYEYVYPLTSAPRNGWCYVEN